MAAAIGLLLISFLVAAGSAGAASCFAPPSGLVDWWPGDGNATDIIGTNNGVLQTGATASAPGFDGTAFSFDGINGFVQFPDAPAFHPAVFTVEAWVNFRSLDSSGNGAPAGQQYIVFKQNTRNDNFEGINLSKGRGTGDFFIFGVSSASGQAAELHSSTLVVTGAWYHVAGVRTSNSIQLYINGQLQAQTNVSFPQDYGTLPLFFGTSGQSFWDRKLNGWLDEVSLYNRALSSNEIASIYAAEAAGKCKAIAVATQPQSQTVPPGATVSFNVGISGTLPIVYQWQRNGTNLNDAGNISGSASNVLTLTNVQTNNSAGYSLIATNISGSVTSAVATLTVDPTLVAPTITNQPASQSVSAGTNVVFTVGATGGGNPLGYQWLLNGVGLTDGGQFSGTATPTLSITYVLPANTGNYSVVVTNFVGSVTSVVATLTVSAPTGCLPMPSGLVGWWPGDFGGQDVIGTNNGTLQGGATSGAPGVVGGAFHMDGTNGYVQINNAPELNQSVLTVECWVRFDQLDTPGTSTVGAQYIVFKQNTRSGNFEGINLSKHRYGYDLIVWEASSASGQATELRSTTAITSNVWYHLAGVRGSNFMELYVNGRLEVHTNINYPQDYAALPLYFGTSNEAYWDHKLSGSIDEVSLYNRPLTSNEIAALYLAGSAGKCKGPAITAQPTGGLLYWGGNTTLNSGASGVNPLALQWLKNNVPVAGATNASLPLTNIQLTGAGSYSLMASNAYGIAASSPASISVKLADVSWARSTAGNRPGFGLNIGGLSNQTYGIQYSPDLGRSNNWFGLTNLTLTSTSNIWIDPQPPTQPKRYYRVVPGPISIP